MCAKCYKSVNFKSLHLETAPFPQAFPQRAVENFATNKMAPEKWCSERGEAVSGLVNKIIY
jgi:hypothetical protein